MMDEIKEIFIRIIIECSLAVKMGANIPLMSSIIRKADRGIEVIEGHWTYGEENNCE